MNVLRYGDVALLAEVDDPLALREALRGLAGVLELVPAARTLLVRFDPAVTAAGALTDVITHLEPTATPHLPGRLITLDVVYDGADLAAVADETGCSLGEVIERHCGAEYRVAFCGFAPGFAYLTGLHPTLHVPRLASPRTSVPAGSVAIAGEYSAVYPRSSPGGWRLLGHTGAVLWDLDRPRPALLTPGTRVRFRPA